MSHQGVAIEEIARLVGYATTRTTEIVYRRELRPVITHRRRDHGPALHRNLAPGPAREPPTTRTSHPPVPRIPDFPAPQAAAIQPIRQDITQ